MLIVKLPLELSFYILDNLDYKYTGLLLQINKEINELVHKYFIYLNEGLEKASDNVIKNVVKIGFTFLLLKDINLQLTKIIPNKTYPYCIYDILLLYNKYIIPNYYLLKYSKDSKKLLEQSHEKINILITELPLFNKKFSLHEFLFIKRELLKIQYILNKANQLLFK
jgi:hypothetical protein